MSVRVGLQFAAPGGAYPCGAWVLDLPGCFTWASDEVTALGQVRGAIRRHMDFLERHHIIGAVEPYGDIEVVERFQCFWTEGQRGRSDRAQRYEVDPTFAADEGAVSIEEVALVRDVLVAARPELLAAAKRAGPGRAGDRGVEEMLHHVANAEWWYGTRLEEDPAALRPFARFEEPDPRTRLAAVREWTLARLERLPELDALAHVHSGERWTPRKLLRRYVYHELDHLAELEARIVAEVG